MPSWQRSFGGDEREQAKGGYGARASEREPGTVRASRRAAFFSATAWRRKSRSFHRAGDGDTANRWTVVKHARFWAWFLMYFSRRAGVCHEHASGSE